MITKEKFIDLISKNDDTLLLETLENGSEVRCEWGTAQEYLTNPPTEKWQEWKDKFASEGRL